MGACEPLEERHALVRRDEEERVVAHLDEELRVDLVVRQVRVRRDLRPALALPEAERAADRLGRGEDPVEPVERALVERRVVLERPHDARDDRALGAPVRPVQQDQPVRPPLPDEVRERPVDLLLHLLLADERVWREPLVPR
jgi:hypothetical protein